MKNKKSKTSNIFLIFATLLTFLSYGYLPHDQFHPINAMLSFLPIQLGTLLWIYLNGYFKVLKKNF